MLAVNYSTLRSKLKVYCDRVSNEDETVIVTRKGEKNVVLISLEDYNALARAARNKEYLEMLDRSAAQIKVGNVVTKTLDELRAMEQ